MTRTVLNMLAPTSLRVMQKWPRGTQAIEKQRAPAVASRLLMGLCQGQGAAYRRASSSLGFTYQRK